MHEMQTIVTDVNGVCLSRMHQMTLAWLHCAGLSAAARAVYRVHGVIWCSLCQMPLASSFDSPDRTEYDVNRCE